MAMMRGNQLHEHLNYISTILYLYQASCHVKLLSDVAFPNIDNFKMLSNDGDDAR